MGLSRNKNNTTREEQNAWIDSVFENASKEDIVWMCSIRAGIHKNQVFNEKLSWNVIDKAGLADEAEIRRRRQFKRKQRRRHIIRVCGTFAIFAALIIILAVNGVFDRNEMHYYRYDIYQVSGAKINTNDMDWYKKVQNASIPELNEIPMDAFPDIDDEILDNTMYVIAAEYCASNDFVIDGYNIQKRYAGQTNSGKYILLCKLELACYDIKKSLDNGENMYYTDFYAAVYTGQVKTSSNVAGIYMCSIKDEVMDKMPGLDRKFVVQVEPAGNGYYISVEDILSPKNGGAICGNALTEAYGSMETPVSTNLRIDKDLKENKTYTFNNNITKNGITFKMKFTESKLMLKYCYKGENINNKDYLEIPKV